MTDQHLVCLTFDFDAVSLWMAQGLTSPTNISRGEFGVVGVERILKLLDRQDIRGSFYIPGVTINTYPETCRAIFDAGHEIGHHGFAHVSPVKMSIEAEREALQKGNDAIAGITGSLAAGYRSPAWDLSPNSVDLLIEEQFLYDSSMMAHDCQPYFARTGDIVSETTLQFGESTGLVELPISWSLDDFPHFEYWRGGGLQNAGLVLENWLDDFRFMKREETWGVMTYTFHPFVIGRGHRMLLLERLIDTLKDEGALFVTAREAVVRFMGRATGNQANAADDV